MFNNDRLPRHYLPKLRPSQTMFTMFRVLTLMLLTNHTQDRGRLQVRKAQEWEEGQKRSEERSVGFGVLCGGVSVVGNFQCAT